MDGDFIELLAVAKSKLRDAVSRLDMTKSSCGSCKLKRYSNFDEHQIGTTLNGIIGKLDTAIGRAKRSKE